MQQTLWGDQIPTRRSRKNERPRISATSFSITGGNDCAIIGHTTSVWDLAGCTLCLDCGAKIFCPICINSHPQDRDAIPQLCPHHEGRAVSI